MGSGAVHVLVSLYCPFQALSRRHSLFICCEGLADLADLSQQYDANHNPPHCPVTRGDLRGAPNSAHTVASSKKNTRY